MNRIDDIMRGGISVILISLGYVMLWCGIFCVIGSATMGSAMTAEMSGSSLLWCGWGCIVFGLIHMGSGIAWYKIAKPKS